LFELVLQRGLRTLKYVIKELAKFEIKTVAAPVAKPEARLGVQNQQSLEYYWAGKRVGMNTSRSPDY
jgi:hypothetical protein